MRCCYSYYLKFLLLSVVFTLIALAFSFCSGVFYGARTKIISSDKKLNVRHDVIIDAGHGGEDGGAEANGVVEKTVNFEIAKMLDSFLFMSSENVHMTRTEDVLLYKPGEENKKKYHDLINRISFANSFENPVFVSIHQNKFEIPKYKGLQVYYSPNDKKSRIFADIVQNNAHNYIDNENNRKTKAANHRIRILDTLEVPAILVECGFLSNPSEAELLNTEDYQEKLAFMLFVSTLEFLYENGDENK